MLTAEKVLTDCKNAYEMLERVTSVSEFRILWVAAMALLRSVGHVLQKVDANRSPNLRDTISQTYDSWKSNRNAHAIFFEFIELERNAVLKEYEFGFVSGPVDLVVLPQNLIYTLGENLYCPISHGRFKGEDCRDKISDAILWWETQLGTIVSGMNKGV